MSRDIHLTSGPIMGQLTRLCLPLLCANVLQQLYNIINSLVVSRFVGPDAFAALGVADSIMNMYLFVLTGACLGASVLIARFYGEKNQAKLRQELFTGLVLIGGFTLAAIALGMLFLPRLLVLIHTPDELMDSVSSYLQIILPGMVFTFAYNYLAAALRAVGDTRAALLFLFLSLGYNLGAAWLFVVALHGGIRGAALATVSAQLLSALLCLLYIRLRRPSLRISRADMRLDRSMARETAGFAAISALHQSSLYLGKLLIQSSVNDLGTAAISAFTAATRAENFIQAFGASGSESTAIFVAQNQGAGQDKRALDGFKRAMAAIVAMGLIFSVLLYTGAVPFIQLFLMGDQGEGLSLGVSYLRLLSWFYWMSFVGHGFVGFFRGSGRMNIPFWGTTTQITIRVVGAWMLVDRMGLNAVALSTGLGWLAIVVFHTACFTLDRRRKREKGPL